MKGLKKFAIIAFVMAIGFSMITCDFGSDVDPSVVEGWRFNVEWGFISGAGDGSFSQYVGAVLTEREWSNVRSYARTDGSSTNASWNEVNDYMREWLFGVGTRDEFKSRLANDEKATYFYVNSYNEYRWFRAERR